MLIFFQVPKGRSAVVIAQAIRDKFFVGYRETEFLVVCDVKKENAQVIQELNDAQVIYFFRTIKLCVSGVGENILI